GEGRQRRQQHLEYPDARQGEHTQETVVRVEGRVAVLPGGLQSSERPPEALFGEISGVLRRFGVRYRLFFIADIESKTADRERQIRVLGERIIAEPARGQDQIFPPCTDCA